MVENEKSLMIEGLDNGRVALLSAIRTVSDNLATRRPAVDKWSILECVEHVAVAEEYLLAQILAATHYGTPVINKQREAAIQVRGLDRTRRIESPDVAKPTGRFATLESAAEHFLSCRTNTIEFLESCNDDLRAMLTDHPTIGRVNCYEMLLLMALHPQRHANQIGEIRAALK